MDSNLSLTKTAEKQQRRTLFCRTQLRATRLVTLEDVFLASAAFSDAIITIVEGEAHRNFHITKDILRVLLPAMYRELKEKGDTCRGKARLFIRNEEPGAIVLLLDRCCRAHFPRMGFALAYDFDFEVVPFARLCHSYGYVAELREEIGTSLKTALEAKAFEEEAEDLICIGWTLRLETLYKRGVKLTLQLSLTSDEEGADDDDDSETSTDAESEDSVSQGCEEDSADDESVDTDDTIDRASCRCVQVDNGKRRIEDDLLPEGLLGKLEYEATVLMTNLHKESCRFVRDVLHLKHKCRKPNSSRADKCRQRVIELLLTALEDSNIWFPIDSEGRLKKLSENPKLSLEISVERVAQDLKDKVLRGHHIHNKCFPSKAWRQCIDRAIQVKVRLTAAQKKHLRAFEE